MPIRVRVLYFGITSDVSGRRDEELSLAAQGSVAQLHSEIEKMHPGLAKLSRVIRLAVDGELVEEERQLVGGETVAVLPPVAGG